jgi:hypothetical protein
MKSGCNKFKNRSWEKAELTKEEAENWKKFVDVAKEGVQGIKDCLPPLCIY